MLEHTSHPRSRPLIPVPPTSNHCHHLSQKPWCPALRAIHSASRSGPTKCHWVLIMPSVFFIATEQSAPSHRGRIVKPRNCREDFKKSAFYLFSLFFLFCRF